MNLTQWTSIVVIIGLAVLPTIIAVWINGPKVSEPEEYDYDMH